MTDKQKWILVGGGIGAYVILRSKGGLSGALAALVPKKAAVKPTSPAAIAAARPTTQQFATGSAPATGRALPGQAISLPLAAAVGGGNALGSFLANLFNRSPSPANTTKPQGGDPSQKPGGGSSSSGAGQPSVGATRGSTKPPTYDPYRMGDYTDRYGNYDPTLDPANYDPGSGEYYGPGAYDSSDPNFNPNLAGNELGATDTVGNDTSYWPGGSPTVDNFGTMDDGGDPAVAADDGSSWNSYTDQEPPAQADQTPVYAGDVWTDGSDDYFWGDSTPVAWDYSDQYYDSGDYA